MRAINHALTGALAGLIIHQPVIAVTTAVASHYLCDSLPHFGRNKSDTDEIKSRFFRNILYIDALLCVALIGLLAFVHPEFWLLSALCAFLAAAPDFFSAPKYFRVRRGMKWRPSRYTQFAKNIQWFERPIGGVVEAAWFTAGIILLVPFVS